MREEQEFGPLELLGRQPCADVQLATGKVGRNFCFLGPEGQRALRRCCLRESYPQVAAKKRLKLEDRSAEVQAQGTRADLGIPAYGETLPGSRSRERRRGPREYLSVEERRESPFASLLPRFRVSFGLSPLRA